MRICGRVLALLCLLALGACDPTPRVFASMDDEALAAVPAATGVMVAPIQGLPQAIDAELRKAITGALQAQGIPATTASAGRAQATLVGQADLATGNTGTPTFIAWTLADPEGRPLASFTGTAALAPGRIVQENPGALSNIVRQVNEALAGAGRRPLTRPAAASRTAIPVVSVLPVEGAPSDGREVLADALRSALRGHGLRVADGIDAEGLIVFGDVLVEPVGDTQEKVSISWQVRWPDGRELGVVSQSNTVPRGATASSWTPVAPVVASNAADGIARLVRQDLPATRAGGTPAR
ncbi:hypothetical protein ABIE65_005205 [Constrictibacter sp. MBR-5]|jgi:hypothetical protein|uniref:hypothetical protein n=1 Tax=Constrictibacter sp. MBR-5 TaxID=3156467 RepID=UPI003395B88A